MSSRNHRLKQPAETAFTGTQLSLFQSFLCNGDGERQTLSNTIELWDGVPKYFVSRQDMNKLRQRGLLPTMSRDFEYRGRAFTVKIRPARLVDEHGKDMEFYPSGREELVEDALRKLAAEQGYGFLERQESGVVFTLHMLRRELGRRGHTLSYQEVVDSLRIMTRCHIEMSAADGSRVFESPILPSLAAISRADYENDPQSRWIAYFNPLITQSIQALTYRQYDYHTMMAHSTQLARWLHKRLAHNYLNASLMQPYRLLFSTMQRDSGLLEYGRLRDAIRKFDQALAELREHKVLLSFDKEERRGERDKILDVAYVLTPHPAFVVQVKAANKRHSGTLGQAPNPD